VGTAAATGVRGGPTTGAINEQSRNATTARTTTSTAAANELRGDKAYTVGDQQLLVRIREDVLPIVGGSAAGSAPIRFVTRHGVVTLSGELASDEMRQRVVEQVRNMEGVRNVVDEIQVGGQRAVGGANSTGEADDQQTQSGRSTSGTVRGTGAAQPASNPQPTTPASR
jgi:osmotically-inducible protein OsmY